jgi:CDP-glycerol glycerophosphotransferase (TagB/SpsB family)
MTRYPGIVRMLDAVRSLFESLRVGAVITISSLYSMDGALNLIARARRIPSLTLQHGLIADHELFCHVPVLATKKLVWREANRTWYQRFGFPESRISVIGSPRFDMIFNRKWCGKEKLCQMLGTVPAKQIVVYVAQVVRCNRMIAPLVFEGLRSIPDLFLVMLLHPGEDPSLYAHLAANFAYCKIVRFGHISLYDALSGADCFITYYSTSALEAMLFQLPVITVEAVPPTFSFGEAGASIRVTNSAELNQAANRLISDAAFRRNAIDRYRQFLADFCIPDGLASKRLIDRIESFRGAGGIA